MNELMALIERFVVAVEEMAAAKVANDEADREKIVEVEISESETLEKMQLLGRLKELGINSREELKKKLTEYGVMYRNREADKTLLQRLEDYLKTRATEKPAEVATEKPAEVATEKPAEVAAEKPTIFEVRAILKDYVMAYGEEKAMTLLKKFGGESCTKLSEVSETKYVDLIKACKGE